MKDCVAIFIIKSACFLAVFTSISPTNAIAQQNQSHYSTINSNPINSTDSASNQDKKKKSIQKSRSDAQWRERKTQMLYQRQRAIRSIKK
ncbi:MAG TPA: hypothetical protein VF691_05185 [Cytophagaceae bacterium]|jgi:hypothetical protein